jgi:hypothetical protein
MSNAALALNERSRNAPFHNYLDDFLAAIRIFGYLEKPVFHELSRHLQTRRLNAGETLEIGTGDFWCVVEGKVQVVSPVLISFHNTTQDGMTHKMLMHSSLHLQRMTCQPLHRLIHFPLAPRLHSMAITS